MSVSICTAVKRYSSGGRGMAWSLRRYSLPETFQPLPGMGVGILLMSLSACSSVSITGPEKGAYDTRVTEAQQHVSAWDVSNTDVDAEERAVEQEAPSLLDLMNSPELHKLVTASLQANPDLQQTLLTLKVLQANWKGTDGQRYPTVSASMSNQRTEASPNVATGSVTVSWELDLWSRLADASDAGAADVAEQLALYQSARDALVAQVMTSWLNRIRLQRDVSVQTLRLMALSKNEAAIVHRYRTGIGSLDDLDSARTALESARSTQANNRYLLAQSERTLRTLLGQASWSSGEIQALPVIPDSFPAVSVPLLTFPDQTLARRPDLVAAYHAIEAANLRARVAYKNLLPTISLSAALTDSANSVSGALFNDPVWSLLQQLTAPLFMGGQLRAAAQSAEWETARRFESYRSTLITAVSEVESALDHERSLTLQEAAIERALVSARANEVRYEQRYRSGLVDLLEVLSVQQSRYDLELSLNAMTYQRLTNRISLGLALGLSAGASDGLVSAASNQPASVPPAPVSTSVSTPVLASISEAQ